MVEYISGIKLMDVKKIDVTHQCDIVYEKNKNLMNIFEELFSKYENNNEDHEEFASEFIKFYKKIRIFKKIKSRPNLTSKVDLYYLGSILTDERIELLFKKNEQTFYELKNMLNNLSVCCKDLDVTNKVKFLNGWITTIRGTMILFKNLKPFGFEYLKTRRVNQDALENFFGSIRRRNGNCSHPTPRQFATTYTQLSVINIMDHSDLFNCEDDGDIILSGSDSSLFGKYIFSI